MTKPRLAALFAAPLAAALMAGLSPSAWAACEAGVYVGSDRDRLVLPVPAEPRGSQRYVFLDGRRGAVDAPQAPVKCEPGAVQVLQADGRWQRWPHLAVTQAATRFKSHGTELAGMLLQPADAAAQAPLVVLVHGSEKTATLGSAYPYLLAAQGLAVFAYDKRGTGESQGFYTQNFELLADDAVAAAAEARRLSGRDRQRLGFAGFSQGGWVAPLAAQRSKADFVVVGFGLVLSPLEEDREQVLSELRHAGADAATLDQAREVTEATGAIVASHFTQGFDTLQALKRRYGSLPWWRRIEGEFTGQVLRTDEATLRRVGVALIDPVNVLWNYDNAALLKQLEAPLLWVVAGEDREAPPEVTRERLLALKRAGKPVALYQFPDTDHGMFEFEQQADGQRRTTRVTEGYYRLLGDWIHGRLAPPYGRGERLE